MFNIEKLIIGFDGALRTLLAPAQTIRTIPGENFSETDLSQTEKNKSTVIYILTNTKLINFEMREQSIVSIVIEQESCAKEVPVSHLILATGHSARDMYELLHSKDILIEAKPFALGVRVEHPQER